MRALRDAASPVQFVACGVDGGNLQEAEASAISVPAMLVPGEESADDSLGDLYPGGQLNGRRSVGEIPHPPRRRPLQIHQFPYCSKNNPILIIFGDTPTTF